MDPLSGFCTVRTNLLSTFYLRNNEFGPSCPCQLLFTLRISSKNNSTGHCLSSPYSPCSHFKESSTASLLVLCPVSLPPSSFYSIGPITQLLDPSVSTFYYSSPFYSYYTIFTFCYDTQNLVQLDIEEHKRPFNCKQNSLFSPLDHLLSTLLPGSVLQIRETLPSFARNMILFARLSLTMQFFQCLSLCYL